MWGVGHVGGARWSQVCNCVCETQICCETQDTNTKQHELWKVLTGTWHLLGGQRQTKTQVCNYYYVWPCDMFHCSQWLIENVFQWYIWHYYYPTITHYPPSLKQSQKKVLEGNRYGKAREEGGKHSETWDGSNNSSKCLSEAPKWARRRSEFLYEASMLSQFLSWEGRWNDIINRVDWPSDITSTIRSGLKRIGYKNPWLRLLSPPFCPLVLISVLMLF